MLLQAMMKLDSTGFTNPLAGLRNSLSGTIKSLAALMGVGLSVAGTISGLKNALQVGGQLSELSQRTGVAVKDLVILRQAFDDTGVGAESGTQAIALMQKSLSGMNDEGQPTNKMFAQLGLNMEQLKSMGVGDQLQTIGKAIMGLKDPAAQTAASMSIFGRSGAAMKQFFSDPAAIETARKSLGTMPEVLDRNAALFDAIGDAMGRIKAKGTGFFAGILEGAAPALKSVTDSIDGMDFSKWGVAIGKVLGTLTEAFKEGKLGTLAGLSLKIGFAEAVNFLAGTIGSSQFWKGVGQLVLSAFLGIGGALLKIFSAPITLMQAGMDFVMDKLFAALAKVPGINKLLGLENYGPGKTFSEHLADRKKEGTFLGGAANESLKMAGAMLSSGMANIRQGIKSKDVINTAEWKKELTDVWGKLRETSAAGLEKLQKEASKPGIAPGEGLLKPVGREKTKLDIASDRLTKIGLYMGGGGGIDMARKTANATERMAKTLDRWLPKLVPETATVSVWSP